MAGRNSKRNSKNRGSGKTLMFLIILLLSVTSIFLLHINRQKERELSALRRETFTMHSKIKDLQSQVNRKDTELAELKIQAVIKDSESSR